MPNSLIKNIELQDMPENLQEAVREYLEKYEDCELLTCKTYKSTPYVDKTIVNTYYKAYLVWGNLHILMYVSDCTKKEWARIGEVKKESMISGDMRVFFENSHWFKD